MDNCTTFRMFRSARIIAWAGLPIVAYQAGFFFFIGLPQWWFFTLNVIPILAILLARLRLCENSVTLRTLMPIRLEASDLVSICLVESESRGRAWSSRIEFRTRTGRVYSSWAVRYAGWWPGLGLLSHRPEHVREVAELISEKLGVPCVPWNN